MKKGPVNSTWPEELHDCGRTVQYHATQHISATAGKHVLLLSVHLSEFGCWGIRLGGGRQSLSLILNGISPRAPFWPLP